jgi:CDGSH-type Zn-finger protein
MTAPTSIVIKPRGPIVIVGQVEIRDDAGNPIPLPPDKPAGTVKLCGCGRSKTRPFCDGSHKETPAALPAP